MKVKHLCEEIAPGSIQAGPHPRRWLLDRDESKGYLQAGKKKEGKKRKFIWSIAAVVVLFENTARLWELDQAKPIWEFVFFSSVLFSVVTIC